MKRYISSLMTLCFSILCLVLAGAMAYFGYPAFSMLFLLLFVVLALEALCSALHARRKALARALEQAPFTTVDSARRDV